MNLRLKGKVEIVYILLMFYGFILTGCQNVNTTEPTSEEVTVEIVSTELNTDETTTNETTISETVSLGETIAETLVGKSTETTPQSTDTSLEEWIDRIVWISGIRPNIAYLYDINGDNLPELIVQLEEEDYNRIYEVYNIFGKKPRMICILEASQYIQGGFINENNFDLYYDEIKDEYFYISTLWLDLRQIVVVYKHTIYGEEIFTKKLAQYNYNMEGQNFYVTKGLFLEEEVIEPGYYNHDDINQVLGVTDYLNQYTLVEKNVQMGEGITEEAEFKEQLSKLCTELNISEQNLKEVDSTSANPFCTDVDNDGWVEFFVHKKSLDKNGNEVWALWKNYLGTYVEMGLFEVTPQNRTVQVYVDNDDNTYILNTYIHNDKQQEDLYAFEGDELAVMEIVTDVDYKNLRLLEILELKEYEMNEDVNPDGPTVISSNPTKNIASKTENDYNTTISSDEVDILIENIISNNICNACLYDFNKDGLPELIEVTDGMVEGQITYAVYALKPESIDFIGYIPNHKYFAENGLALFKDMDTQQYFYVGIRINAQADYTSVKINMYRFRDMEILVEELASFEFARIEEQSGSDKVYLKENYFLGENILPEGYRDSSEIIKDIGLDAYLEKYELVEVVDLEPLWGYDLDDESKQMIEQALVKWYSKE